MRILLGNQIDDTIRGVGDMSAAAQRVLWFANDHDLLVLPTVPDPDYVAHVTGLTGTDPSTLRVCVTPPDRHGGRLLDPQGLTDPDFLRTVAAGLDPEAVSEVFALWPSASVARFADSLGIAHALPGAAFIAQGGGEPVNSKAFFRALAAGAGVAVAEGTVCHGRAEAEQALAERIAQSGAAVVVKQAHNGSGNGNHIVFGGATADTGHAGARHVSVLGSGPGEVREFWERQWSWASAGGRFPVVVEAYVPGAVSVYAEYRVTDDGVAHTGAGILGYADRLLDVQVVPLRPADIGAEAHRLLLAQGERLAETYRATGYRGHLSADAIVDTRGRIVFTEVNAHVSGSLHLYDAIAERLVGVSTYPERTVAEYEVPEQWGLRHVTDFVAGARAAGCLYDPSTRLGALVSTAPLWDEDGGAAFMFCLVYDTHERREDLRTRLAREFTSRGG
ncbi:hypothetical protein [Streptomyces chattanoogensis]|uniref:preATP grasp domain-containing protein n=1 Tax=Streptomyces chattanoogensis TaxID=66876 RepID=UPI0006B5053C|nr:hypothetical protein [Streptomyces chattanoogensis]